MKTIPLDVDDLNDDGASYMLEQLYGLPENCISSWASMGPVLERNKVSVQYSGSSNDWTASIAIEDADEYSSAANPRLAAARVLVKKTILENPENSFALRLSLKAAFQIGVKCDGLLMEVLRASGGIVDEDEKVIIELKV